MHENYSNIEILFLILTITVGFGVISLPKSIAEVAGTGGWFTLLLTTIIAMIVNYMVISLAYSNSEETLYDYSKKLLGKKLTLIVACIYAFDFFLLPTFVLRNTSEIIKHSILLKTPTWILTLVFLIVIGYALNRGIKTISLVCQIYGIIFILSGVISSIFIFTKGDIYNILPIFDIDSIGAYTKGIFTKSAIFSFMGIEFISFIPLSKKKNKNISKYAFWITGFIGLLYILVFESSIAIMGVHDIVFYKDSVIATIRRVELPFLQFLGRLDGIFTISWLSSIFCTSALYFYGSVHFIGKIFKGRINKKVIIFIVMVIAFISSEIPRTVDAAENMIEFISYFGLSTYIIIPFILLILSNIKKNKKNI
ncbi:endospore germination permease [Clostridium oceanicum]|uniref:GerAB/ArcD/ProY family transporter n=1 Tax=Clostridium oceanicum TaxID=1543 RepID=A0ABN1JIJ9_9CLOT